MSGIRIFLIILMVLDCIGLVAIVLMQEGRTQGLGAISGAAETYWGKNRARSMEGRMEKITVVLSILFFVLALLLNMKAIP